jgi:serine phosphatase RsbU (regulator of sigma subunit)
MKLLLRSSAPLLLCILFTSAQSSDFTVAPALLSQEDAFLPINNWKYFPGDLNNGQDSNLDDTNWSKVEQSLEIPRDWKGTGWYRIHLMVDPHFLRKPLALTIRHAGTIWIYLNGTLIYNFSIDTQNLRRNPVVIQFDQPQNLLAVQYADPNPEKLSRLAMLPGFQLAFKKLEDTNRYMVGSVYHLVFLIALLIAFAFLHFFLYFFDRKEKLNMYFGLFSILVALLVITEIDSIIIDRTEVAMFRRLWAIGQVCTILVALRFTYLLSRNDLPKHFFVFAAVGVGLLVWGWNRLSGGWYAPAGGAVYLSLWTLFAMIEMMRVLLTKRTKEKSILVFGSAPIVIVATYQMLINLNIGKSPGVFFDYVPLPYYAFLILAGSMSLFLSRNVARTNRDLKAKLLEVKELSRIQLEQEKRAREEEVARKLLEADNLRKTQELEDARRLQLSMLPAKVPKIPGLELAFYMKTAVEVGGDYYDFHHENGCLTIAIGDATGHGVAAGTMVTAAKGLFLNLAPKSEIPETMNQMTSTFRKMNLGRIFMAMTIAKIEGRNLKLVSAGMPPAFLCRHSGEIDVIKTHAIPLGLRNFNYEVVERHLESNDMLVLLSDGLPEMFNLSNEILGYDRIPDLLVGAEKQSPENVIQQLLDEAHRWANGRPQDDDMTFVILRYTATDFTI